MNNICRFTGSERFSDNIHIINFVYETDPKKNTVPSMSAVYRVYYVTEGSADVHCGNYAAKVKKGDVFFIFPALDFSVCGDNCFACMYISYVGIRPQAEMEYIGICPQNSVFEDMSDVYDMWMQGLSVKNSYVSLACEGIVLYTLAKIADRYFSDKQTNPPSKESVNISDVENFIDEHFRESDLSLQTISEYFSYNKKYLSALFKKKFKVSIVEHIKTLRINYACSLIEKNYGNVKEIASLSGFDDALYFSRVFKQKTGSSPKQYMSERADRRG